RRRGEQPLRRRADLSSAIFRDEAAPHRLLQLVLVQQLRLSADRDPHVEELVLVVEPARRSSLRSLEVHVRAAEPPVLVLEQEHREGVARPVMRSCGRRPTRSRNVQSPNRSLPIAYRKPGGSHSTVRSGSSAITSVATAFHTRPRKSCRRRAGSYVRRGYCRASMNCCTTW